MVAIFEAGLKVFSIMAALLGDFEMERLGDGSAGEVERGAVGGGFSARGVGARKKMKTGCHKTRGNRL